MLAFLELRNATEKPIRVFKLFNNLLNVKKMSTSCRITIQNCVSGGKSVSVKCQKRQMRSCQCETKTIFT
jgi:hypothetical protein